MQIGVYGLGRFGAFWAELLSRRFSVFGYSRSSERPTPRGVERVDLDRLADCDVVFLCVAISALDEVLRDFAPRLTERTLVADTCSVKMAPVAAMRSHLPPQVSILGTHPMFGPDSAKNGVSGLPIVLSDVRIESEDSRFWRDTFRTMGMRVIDRSPEEHDREAAYTQGITHLVGRLLNSMELEDSEIATLGYKQLLQVIEQTCNDPWQLFVDLQRANPFTSHMRRRFADAARELLEHPSLTVEEDAP
jgi:prephenate dehydrogenase